VRGLQGAAVAVVTLQGQLQQRRKAPRPGASQVTHRMRSHFLVVVRRLAQLRGSPAPS
jgi:hypothetical protein